MSYSIERLQARAEARTELMDQVLKLDTEHRYLRHWGINE